ncbi:hypothetical protein Taro_021497 [Colocasia esculenta]|uniref:Uncharacterized protein n=1 Tax=Colocasia esculenta TaxID=4460 RepID=A0A843V1E6_COLES|nr:hypothetical protein [Colocasia esculenta]
MKELGQTVQKKGDSRTFNGFKSTHRNQRGGPALEPPAPPTRHSLSTLELRRELGALEGGATYAVTFSIARTCTLLESLTYRRCRPQPLDGLQSGGLGRVRVGLPGGRHSRTRAWRTTPPVDASSTTSPSRNSSSRNARKIVGVKKVPPLFEGVLSARSRGASSGFFFLVLESLARCDEVGDGAHSSSWNRRCGQGRKGFLPFSKQATTKPFFLVSTTWEGGDGDEAYSLSWNCQCDERKQATTTDLVLLLGIAGASKGFLIRRKLARARGSTPLFEADRRTAAGTPCA